ncbi:MAG: hypothetical protein RR381_00340 [Raoultibacter sp.]
MMSQEENDAAEQKKDPVQQSIEPNQTSEQTENAAQQAPTLGQPTPQDLQALKSARNFIIAGNVMGPVSLLFGGVILSSAALIVEFIAFRKLSRLIKSGNVTGQIARRLKGLNIAGLVISAVALALNIYAVIIMYPIVLEAVKSGDYSGILGSESIAPATDTSSSAWG